ncbi:MAG: IreB family regulatory phosphoprotein [Clostridiaceae bacterium]|nr:IreB family regulatory phosphoprotein [Clostridiaceae bacterium]
MNSGTMKFDFNNDSTNQSREIILKVYEALTEKGYNPISQLVGYIMSGDPTYITSHKNARSLIRRLERDEIIEELVRYYIR